MNNYNQYNVGDKVYVSEFSKTFDFVSKDVYDTGFGVIESVILDKDFNYKYKVKFNNGSAIIPERFIMFRNAGTSVKVSNNWKV